MCRWFDLAVFCKSKIIERWFGITYQTGKYFKLNEPCGAWWCLKGLNWLNEFWSAHSEILLFDLCKSCISDDFLESRKTPMKCNWSEWNLSNVFSSKAELKGILFLLARDHVTPNQTRTCNFFNQGSMNSRQSWMD